MDRSAARALLDRLHAAQNVMYAGGEVEPVRVLLTSDVEWHVPGHNAIAGVYRGVEAVVAYFERRRALAHDSMRLHPGELLLGDRDHVAVLTDGTAVIGGAQRRWSTLGLYRITDGKVAACWLLPLDQEAFDHVWSDRAG